MDRTRAWPYIALFTILFFFVTPTVMARAWNILALFAAGAAIWLALEKTCERLGKRSTRSFIAYAALAAALAYAAYAAYYPLFETALAGAYGGFLIGMSLQYVLHSRNLMRWITFRRTPRS